MKHTTQIVILSHGWSYDHTFFTPWLNHIQTTTPQWFASTQFFCINRGYYAPSHTTELMAYENQQWQPHPAETLHGLVLQHAQLPWIGVGHSLGFSQLLDYSIRWSSLISLHGFTQFAKSANNLYGVGVKVIERMQSKLQNNPLDLLKAFQTQCGYVMPLEAITDTQALYNDLHSMLNLNTAPQLQTALNHGTKLLAISNPHDPIVPQTLSEFCFPVTTTVECLHAGLFTEPARYTPVMMPYLNCTLNA